MVVDKAVAANGDKSLKTSKAAGKGAAGARIEKKAKVAKVSSQSIASGSRQVAKAAGFSGGEPLSAKKPPRSAIQSALKLDTSEIAKLNAESAKATGAVVPAATATPEGDSQSFDYQGLLRGIGDKRKPNGVQGNHGFSLLSFLF